MLQQSYIYLQNGLIDFATGAAFGVLAGLIFSVAVVVLIAAWVLIQQMWVQND